MPWHSSFSVKHVSHQLRRCSSLKEVESWYALVLKCNATQDCFLVNQYITACSNFRGTDSAAFAFAQTENPNVFVYNAAIGAFVNCLLPLQALHYYVLMLRNGVHPSSYTFPPVIKGCRALSAAKLGQCVHSQVVRVGLAMHVHVQTTLVDFYSELGGIVESRKVFDEMPERDGFAWAAMITANIRAGDMYAARKMFDEMPEKSSATWNAVIHGYAEAGDVESAEETFRAMLERDVISWTTMIHCYCKHKRYTEALQVFKEMKSARIRPDEVTIATVISACAHLGALDQGMEMHLYIMQTWSHIDVFVGSALIDMYAKCGMLERALVVFFKLPEKNLFCWSSVIDGLAVHGYAKEALAMFDRMVEEKIEPNSIVFVSVLAACTHAGMVEQGKQRFLEMTSRYSMLPEIEHYGCIIDLLCRVGLLDEALVLIRSMIMQPNAVIWGALLGGCKLHKNLEIAQIAVERLMTLEPNNSGYYTLLINMHAEVNRWGDVARIRAIMREQGAEKTLPGFSWIEIEKKTHLFAACDNYHPSLKEIHSVLDMLDPQLKLFDYAHFLDFDLQ